MEHSHPFPGRMTPGCPACDQLAEARNRAIGHLSEALYLLAGLRGEDDPATIRLNLAPISLPEDFTRLCHNIDLSAKEAEALSDAIDSMNAYASSDAAFDSSDAAFDDKLRAAFQEAQPALEALTETDEASVARRLAKFKAWLEGQNGEAIASGEWSAAAVAQCTPDLYADVTDLFAELDLREVTKQVLDDATADNLTVNRALDSFFGEIADPYADEDEA